MAKGGRRRSSHIVFAAGSELSERFTVQGFNGEHLCAGVAVDHATS